MEKVRIYAGGGLHETEKAQLKRWRRKYGGKFYYIREMRLYVPVSASFRREFLREEWRQEKREQRRPDFPCPPAELLDWQAERETEGVKDPAELLLQRERKLEILERLSSLTGAERELISLLLQGCSEREMAARLDCSKTGVHKRKLRLRERLASLLG